MSAVQIYLARHGQTDDNVPPLRFQGQRDSPLNETGWAQAEALAEKVVALGLRAIYTSQLTRARETATAIAARVGIEPVIDERLAEGWRGEWEGRLVGDVEREESAAYAAWRATDPEFRFPCGESLKEHQARALAAMAQIAVGPRPALVVSHGGTIRCILSHLTGVDLSHFHEQVVDNARLIPLDGRATRLLRTAR